MKMSSNCARLATAGGLLLACTAAFANGGTKFSDFTPLVSSAPATADEAAPITFGNPIFRQRSIADRTTQWRPTSPTVATGHEHPHETGRLQAATSSPVRDDRGRAASRPVVGHRDHLQSPAPATSPSTVFLTPWGTLITGEEAWDANVVLPTAACSSANHARSGHHQPAHDGEQ
jgi:hypothetical protein